MKLFQWIIDCDRWLEPPYQSNVSILLTVSFTVKIQLFHSSSRAQIRFSFLFFWFCHLFCCVFMVLISLSAIKIETNSVNIQLYFFHFWFCSPLSNWFVRIFVFILNLNDFIFLIHELVFSVFFYYQCFGIIFQRDLFLLSFGFHCAEYLYS